MHITWREWHHLYLGIILEMIGWGVLLAGYVLWGFVLIQSGRFIQDDDKYQHTRQLCDHDYHSPLHYVFGKYLYKYRIIRWMTGLLDRVSGKRIEQ